MPFRDVWIVAAGGGQPRRLPDMARSFSRARPADGNGRSTDLMAKGGGAQPRRCRLRSSGRPTDSRSFSAIGGDIFRINADGQGLARVQQGVAGPEVFAWNSRRTAVSCRSSRTATSGSGISGAELIWVRATRVGVPTITTGAERAAGFSVPDVEFQRVSLVA